MADPIKFPFQNFAYTCADIPGCETLHVQRVPDVEMGTQQISAHRLSPEELAAVNASGGVVWLGIFGAGLPPLKVYGANPWGESPEELLTQADVLAGHTFASLLVSCNTAAEFVNLWNWYGLEARADPGAWAAYREAETRWPEILYPLDLLPRVLAPRQYAEATEWQDAAMIYPPRLAPPFLTLTDYQVASPEGFPVVEVLRSTMAYAQLGYFDLLKRQWFILSELPNDSRFEPWACETVQTWRLRKAPAARKS